MKMTQTANQRPGLDLRLVKDTPPLVAHPKSAQNGASQFNSQPSSPSPRVFTAWQGLYFNNTTAFGASLVLILQDPSCPNGWKKIGWYSLQPNTLYIMFNDLTSLGGKMSWFAGIDAYNDGDWDGPADCLFSVSYNAFNQCLDNNGGCYQNFTYNTVDTDGYSALVVELDTQGKYKVYDPTK
jgi:uncharacterized membrane protein